MYLIDRDIRGLLEQMDICTDNEEFPFLPDEQIQPCSVDLRLSNVFWVPTRRATIDLRKSRLLELSPRRYWKRVVLRSGECITLKPGKLLLGRIHEKFTIPVECAGKIEGRSSFARMGLMIHCTGDFINPGYRGHMPLQLVNLGSNAIKIFPYLPICQMKLVRLSGKPERLYGERELQSKYMDDDGGPSYWWRDKRMKKLQEKLGEVDIAIAIQDDILETIGVQEPELIERFERLVGEMPGADLENAEALLDSFAKSEDRRRFRVRLAKAVLSALFPFFLSISLGCLVEQPIGPIHIAFWIATVIALPISWCAFRFELGECLGEKELWRIRQSLG